MERYDANRGQSREALMRLEMTGLVRIIPKVGTIVEDVSFQKLKAVFEVSSHLIRLAGKLAAERLTDEELEDIRNRINQMTLVEDNQTLIRLAREIHKIINKASKNDVLEKILSWLHDQVVRIWTFTGNIENYWIELVEEFGDIANALEQHDGEATASLLERHANVLSKLLACS
jgi:DNA-binding GntR family transcriptional regulator